MKKQKVTISLSPETIRKAKIVAARRSTSISGLLADQIEGWSVQKKRTSAPNVRHWLCSTRAFIWVGVLTTTRNELHER